MFIVAVAFAAAAATGSCEKIPLFARFATDRASLRRYSVPVQTAVTIRRLLTFHVRLNGTVTYQRPGAVNLNMRKVPPQDRQLFGQLGAPRTWPQKYDMQLIGMATSNGQRIYHLKGVPRQRSGVDHFVADVNSDGSSISANWFLRGGGTITSVIQTHRVGRYTLPMREVANINVSGYRIHADMKYGRYVLNKD